MNERKSQFDLKSVLDKVEEKWESAFFATRWVLVPAYIVLILSLLILVVKAAQAFWSIWLVFLTLSETETIVRVLHIVDIVLVLNLVLMVIFVGYINFVSTIDGKKNEAWETKDKPSWMDDLDYAGLKVKLLGSILAISSVKLLTYSIELDRSTAINEQKFIWLIAIQITMVVSVVCLAITNRIKSDKSKKTTGK